MPDFRDPQFLLDHIRHTMAFYHPRAIDPRGGFFAAALLAKRTGEEKYWQWYERIWDYSWTHFVDHDRGAWYRILTRDNRKYSDEKSPAGKTDYHTMGACYEVLNAVN